MRDGARAVALAAALLGWSVLAPRLPGRWNPLPQLAFSAAIARLSPAPLGLTPPRLWKGLAWGSGAAAPVLVSVAAGAAIAPVRAGMAARRLPDPAGSWLLLRIPFGTVWPEEVTYRATLGAAAERAFGATPGRLFAAAVFGLFASLFPNVLPSTIDPAYSLTIENASSTQYTLEIMSWLALIALPLVMLYQGWTY